VIVDDAGLEEKAVMLHLEDCKGFDNQQLQEVLQEFETVMSDVPGSTDIVKMSICLEQGATVISQAPYQIPDR